MISPKHILLSTLVLSCVAAGVSAQASALSGLSGVSGFHNTASMYTQFIAEHLQKAEVPGAIVGIWQSGRPVYLQAFGTANSAEKTAMSVRMNMPIGQLSTAFTVRAVLDLAKAAKIQLSAPVSRYVSGVPDGEHMTVADLAQMRSGLVDFSKQAAYLDAIQKNPEARLLPDQLLHYSFTHPLLFKPGSRFDYSSTNTILLGLIIEKVTGKPLSRVITEQVLQPNRLNSTTFSTSFADPFLQVRGYARNSTTQNLQPVAWNPSQFWAAGAMTATASDLRDWARINANLTEYNHILAAYPQSPASGQTTTSVEYRWGSFVNHGWVGNASYQAGFESIAIYAPKTKDTIVILLNSEALDKGVPLAASLAQRLSRFISPHAIYQSDGQP